VVSAFDIARYMALGADWWQQRSRLQFSLGCLQAQTCTHRPLPHRRHHAGPLRQKSLVVADKAQRV